MKSVWGLMVLVIFAVGLNSCFDAPTYPDSPEIEFKSVQFVAADTAILLKVSFKDGDGDLGLSPEGDNTDQYAARYYFMVGERKLYYTNDPSALATAPNIVRYKTKRTNHNYDTLPAYVDPYTCTNWQIITKTEGVIEKVVDTIYFQNNLNNKNIFIDFLVKQSNGTFQKYNFFQSKDFCLNYDSRFPVLSKDLTKKSPLEGDLEYAIPALGLQFAFSGKTLKLKVRIQDRALHKSNTIETPEFQLK